MESVPQLLNVFIGVDGSPTSFSGDMRFNPTGSKGAAEYSGIADLAKDFLCRQAEWGY